MTGRLDMERRGRVLVLTMTDPANRNALGTAMMARGRDALDEAVHDDRIGALVLTGADGAKLMKSTITSVVSREVRSIKIHDVLLESMIVR